jgi:hypothetical protein
MEPQAYQAKPSYQDESLKNVRRLRLAAVLFALLILVLGAYALYNTVVFRIVSTNPSLHDVSYMSPFLNVTFNKPLSSGNLILSTTGGAIASHRVSNNVLTITLKEPLQIHHTYTITIQAVESKSGAHLTNKQFTFTTTNTGYNSLPKDQQNALTAKNQDTYVPVKQDPILTSLPHSTLDYILQPTYVTSQNGQSQLQLQAQLLVRPGVTGTAEDAAVAQYKQEVNDYISSVGLNPANYTIQYQIVQEDVTGP